MTTTEDPTIAEEAQRLLEEADGKNPLPEMDADVKVSVLGMQFATDRQFVLGERVELRVVGWVNFAGEQLIENEGKRTIVKIQSSLITVLDQE